jgi:hypothetical protein
MKLLTLDQLLDLLDLYRHSELHIHHTWEPEHKDFKGDNHLALQQGMKNYHVNMNGWDDIAQHATLFPDGKLMTGRAFNSRPASIKGVNGTETNIPFMVEMIGNFDIGHDKLEGEQRESIISLARYFDSKGRYIRFHRENSVKTCPGTGIDKEKFMEEVRKQGMDKEIAQDLLDLLGKLWHTVKSKEERDRYHRIANEIRKVAGIK